MKSGSLPVHRIELRLREVAQLFNSMDPTPFHHKDLDPDAEEFIESWALGFPPDSRFHINIHVERLTAEGEPAALVTEAIHNFFDYKAELTGRELRQLMEQGRTSLVIGLAFLVLCLLVADLIAKVAAGTFLNIVRESLTIGGWVAMWRPLQIFLYDWWPLTRRRRIYRSLGRAHVRVMDGSVHPGAADPK
jgi:hypothetical protein